MRIGNLEVRLMKDNNIFKVEDKHKPDMDWNEVQKFDDERMARGFVVGATFGFMKHTKLDKKCENDYMICEDCDAKILRW